MPLEELLRLVWWRRWRVVLLALILFAAGAAAIHALPRAYVAEAVVAPSETTGIATSALLAPGAAGTLLETRPSGNFAVYLGTLRSAEAVAMLARETPLLERLAERRGDGPMGGVRRALGLRLDADQDDLRDWLERRLSVTQGLGSVTWTVALAHPDRALALEALQRLHGFAEAKVRADLAQLARRRVAALEERLAREPDLYIRQSLYELLAQQQRAGVVVAADEAVAARLVQAPMVEQRPSLPNRALLLLLLLAVAAPLASAVLVAALSLLRAPVRAMRLEPAE